MYTRIDTVLYIIQKSQNRLKFTQQYYPRLLASDPISFLIWVSDPHVHVNYHACRWNAKTKHEEQ